MNEWIVSEDIRVLQKIVDKKELPGVFGRDEAISARNFHKQIEGYEKTKLVRLKGLAKKLGVKEIFVKDESSRFSLNAFKGLGGSYAMYLMLCEQLNMDPDTSKLSDFKSRELQAEISKMHFITCTDGNHGKGVSWAAGLFGCKAHIYMPRGSEEIRADAIRNAGPATVEITNLSYDDTVRYAKKLSEDNGWLLIQDTSWDGYEKIPTWIIQGYLTMAEEIVEDMEQAKMVPSHVFLQTGVGSMAGGIIAYLTSYYEKRKPIMAIVEPHVANCMYISAKNEDGNAHSVGGSPKTIMAGLNCGTPCSIIWPIIRDYSEFYISCSDEVAAEGMRAYAAGIEGDEKIISGGSGASTLGAAIAVLNNPECMELREAMSLTSESVLLFINTEGNTDPFNYEQIVGNLKLR